MTFGETIKKERVRQDLSQDAVKNKAGISLDTLRRYEKDKVKNPSVFTREAILRALDIKFEI